MTVSGTKISRQLFPEPGQIVTEIGKKYIKVIILKSDSPAATDVSLETTGDLRMPK